MKRKGNWNPWNKGKTYSEEVCKKMSGRMKGHPTSEKTKEKISQSMKGRTPWNKDKKGLQKHSEETK